MLGLYSTVQYSTIRYGSVRFDSIRFSSVLHGSSSAFILILYFIQTKAGADVTTVYHLFSYFVVCS